MIALPAATHAQDQATDTLARVVAIQPPAWLLHRGARGAAVPGSALVAGDLLETGADGRVHFEAAEGSTVQLGAQARLELPELRRLPPEPVTADAPPQGVYKATLHLLKGAFRFTTRQLDKSLRRDIGLQVGTAITGGIRGTDVWLKADDAQDLLCLIDGKVEIAGGAGGGEPLTMDQPHTFYVVLHGQPPKKVVQVPDGKFDEWFPQTDLKPGEPALYADGRWAVVLITYASPVDAQQQAQELFERGFPAEVRVAKLKGADHYRVAVPGLRSRADAEACARLLGSRYNYRGAWALAPG